MEENFPPPRLFSKPSKRMGAQAPPWGPVLQSGTSSSAQQRRVFQRPKQSPEAARQKKTAHFLQSFNWLVQNFSAIKRNVKKLLPTPKGGANLMPKLNEDRGAVRKSTFGM